MTHRHAASLADAAMGFSQYCDNPRHATSPTRLVALRF
jgi:hypothetical protein